MKKRFPSSRQENKRPHQRSEKDRRDRKMEPAAGNAGVIFGVLPVLEALRARARRIDKVLIAQGVREHRLNDIVELARENGIAVTKIPREDLERQLEPGVNHQGVAAIASAADYVGGDEILDSPAADPLLVILDGVEDPRNFGAILRTAECAGVDGVFIPERRAVGLTETVVKSAAGATEYVKVAKAANINRLIDELKEKNIWVVGTSGESTTDYTDWDWTQPSALVLGNEGSGLHRLVAENCDVLVKIPMYGKIDSLNVSVAAGVVLFEARRQRAEKTE